MTLRFPIAIGAVLAFAACHRASPSPDGGIRPLPAAEAEQRARPPISAQFRDASPPQGPVGRKPRPVDFEGHDAFGNYAHLAPPSPDHPRGTLANWEWHDRVGAPGDGGRALFDALVVEIDLATGVVSRTLDAIPAVIKVDILDGTRGPILVGSGERAITVVWYDKALSELARRSFPVLRTGARPCRSMAAVGDRVAVALCGVSPTPVWVLGQDAAFSRRCPGSSADIFVFIAPRRDDVFVGGLHDEGEEGGALPCAFNAAGKGPVRSRAYPRTSTFAAFDNEAYILVPEVHEATKAASPLGDDLRPTGAPIAYPPPRPAEEIPAEHLGITANPQAELINGIVVIRGMSCCDAPGPELFVLDPHADDD